MAVMGTWPFRAPAALQCGQSRVEPSSDDDEVQPGLGGQLQDQRVRIDGEEAGAEVAHGLDEHHRVLAPADRHQQARAGARPRGGSGWPASPRPATIVTGRGTGSPLVTANSRRPSS